MFYENTSDLISQLFSIVSSMNFNSEDIAHNLYFFLKDRPKTEKFRTRRLLEYVCMKQLKRANQKQMLDMCMHLKFFTLKYGDLYEFLAERIFALF